MSFSSEVKEEMNRLANLSNKEVVKYELLGYLASNHIVVEKNKIKFTTENEYNINRFGKLISNLGYADYTISMIGKKYCIICKKIELEEIRYQEDKIHIDIKKEEQGKDVVQIKNEKQGKDGIQAQNEIQDKDRMQTRNAIQGKNAIQAQNIMLGKDRIKGENEIKEQELLEKAFVRGAFLGGGSMNNPKLNYHLQLLFSVEENKNLANSILESYEIYFKTLQRKKDFVLYTKDGDEISKFLAFINASNAVLKFEEIRVYRDVRNNVNRKVNCETANLNKTVNAAMKQIEDIQFLIQNNALSKLSKPLQEIARLRIENPEASLAELGKMLSSPIGKSGVNHRLQAIQEKAEQLRNK